jgi:hypothetical protein
MGDYFHELGMPVMVIVMFVLLMLATPVLSSFSALVFGGVGFGLSIKFWLLVWLLYVAPNIG